MNAKAGILQLDQDRAFAGGIDEYRLQRLIEDRVLVRKEDGLDATQFFSALARQEEVSERLREPRRAEDSSARFMLAFTPGASAERLPGVDYDAAIRNAVAEGSGDYQAVAAIEACVLVRAFRPRSSMRADATSRSL
jgi:hypothetical protein